MLIIFVHKDGMFISSHRSSIGKVSSVEGGKSESGRIVPIDGSGDDGIPGVRGDEGCAVLVGGNNICIFDDQIAESGEV